MNSYQNLSTQKERVSWKLSGTKSSALPYFVRIAKLTARSPSLGSLQRKIFASCHLGDPQFFYSSLTASGSLPSNQQYWNFFHLSKHKKINFARAINPLPPSRSSVSAAFWTNNTEDDRRAAINNRAKRLNAQAFVHFCHLPAAHQRGRFLLRTSTRSMYYRIVVRKEFGE